MTIENYGGGNSTGLSQLGWWKILTGFTPDDLFVTPSDREVLRHLAERIAEIASSSKMQNSRELWKRHNSLERTRPIVFCDPENGWSEIITEAQMRCTGKLARRWEMDLRKEIFWGEEMGDDKPVEIFFDVPYTVTDDDWGVESIRYHKTESLGSYVWESPIKNYKTDLCRLHSPTFEIDWITTRGCLEIADDLFRGILAVRLKGIWWWSLGITYPAILFRGLTNMLYDFYDNPDELNELFSIISKGHLDKLDYLERNGLLSLNNDGSYVGSGGFGYTEELPQSDFNGRVRSIDMWGFTESQETGEVSPDMYERFIYPFEKPIMDRFGLTCYGCCEPLHSRWHVICKHHSLRRVSCSPWADVRSMASFLGDKYILSLKPNPSAIATPSPDWTAIRRKLRETLEIVGNCIVEIIMKDCHTIGDRPENVVNWCRIAKEEAISKANLWECSGAAE